MHRIIAPEASPQFFHDWLTAVSLSVSFDSLYSRSLDGPTCDIHINLHNLRQLLGRQIQESLKAASRRAGGLVAAVWIVWLGCWACVSHSLLRVCVYAVVFGLLGRPKLGRASKRRSKAQEGGLFFPPSRSINKSVNKGQQYTSRSSGEGRVAGDRDDAAKPGSSRSSSAALRSGRETGAGGGCARRLYPRGRVRHRHGEV